MRKDIKFKLQKNGNYKIKIKISSEHLKRYSIKQMQKEIIKFYSYKCDLEISNPIAWKYRGYLSYEFNNFFRKLYGNENLKYTNIDTIIKLNDYLPILSVHDTKKRDDKWALTTNDAQSLLKNKNLEIFKNTHYKFMVDILKGFKILISGGNSNHRLNLVYNYLLENNFEYYVNIQTIHDYNELLKKIIFKKNILFYWMLIPNINLEIINQ